MGEPISALIIDDNELARMGVARLLSTQSDVRLVGEAVDGPSGIKMYTELNPRGATPADSEL